MAGGLKKAVFKLIDKAFAQEGYVVGVKRWNPETMYEIDLHLPEVDMQKWTTIPRLKIRVSDPGEYRDYTPASWNVETRVCTLLIETDHPGFGSSWAKNLAVGDVVVFAPAHAANLPARSGNMACFGDGSSLGHFMALKQLTNRVNHPMQVVIFLNEDYKLSELFTKNHPEFQFIMNPRVNSLDALRMFSEDNLWTNLSSIYIAGYIPMVTGLRKVFKSNRQLDAKIYAHGFWS